MEFTIQESGFDYLRDLTITDNGHVIEYIINDLKQSVYASYAVLSRGKIALGDDVGWKGQRGKLSYKDMQTLKHYDSSIQSLGIEYKRIK